MQNIEIKARCADLANAKKNAVELGADFGGELHQIDTYFKVNNGRLKLREISGRESELIYYERPNESAARLSNYHIYPVSNPEILKAMLVGALGIWRVVDKRRLLYWFDNIRIHLDYVSGLGSFIEFEGIVESPLQTAEVHKKVDRLLQVFALSLSDLISLSYSDLIT